MAITGNASYIPTMNEFAAHWALCNVQLAPAALLISMPDKTSMSKVQFDTVRTNLQAQQTTVQSMLNDQQIARGDIVLKKEGLLAWFNQFTELLEAYYQGTKYFAARPKAPGIGDGQENFTRPLIDAMTLWEKVNLAPAPAGVTLPLTLADGTAHGTFASAVSSLQFAYATEASASQSLNLARMDRDELQDVAYAAMKSYRKAVPPRLAQHPTLVETLPALTPVGGHTPDSVNVSGIFLPPDSARVVYTESSDPDLKEYQLRGTVGDHYDDDDAVVIATNSPAAPREFLTTFGLTQPGAQIALKVFVILHSGNESGSAAVLLDRPAEEQQQAA